jgi:hypothetical protein
LDFIVFAGNDSYGMKNAETCNKLPCKDVQTIQTYIKEMENKKEK